MHLQTQQIQAKSYQLNVAHLIEQEFQDYFKVLLYKHDEDCYSVPEWDNHFGWGNRQFTLKQLQVLIRGHRNLAEIAPAIQSFSWLQGLKSDLGH